MICRGKGDFPRAAVHEPGEMRPTSCPRHPRLPSVARLGRNVFSEFVPVRTARDARIATAAPAIPAREVREPSPARTSVSHSPLSLSRLASSILTPRPLDADFRLLVRRRRAGSTPYYIVDDVVGASVAYAFSVCRAPSASSRARPSGNPAGTRTRNPNRYAAAVSSSLPLPSPPTEAVAGPDRDSISASPVRSCIRTGSTSCRGSFPASTPGRRSGLSCRSMTAQLTPTRKARGPKGT